MKPTYEMLGAEVGLLVDRKQRAYGDSFGRSGDFLRLLYPNGVTAAQLDDVLPIARIFDKLSRIAAGADKDGESPYQDIAGYGLLGLQLANQRAEERMNRECASARQDVAERSTEPNVSAAHDASRRTIVNAGESSAQPFAQPLKPPCASTSERMAASVPSATANVSVEEAVRRDQLGLCAACPNALAGSSWVFNSSGVRVCSCLCILRWFHNRGHQ
jgi:hypothetical protein